MERLEERIRQARRVDARTRLAAMLRRPVASGSAPERAVEVVFGDDPPPTTVGDLTSRIAASPSGFHKDWRRNGLPGTPYNLVEWGVLAAAAGCGSATRRSCGWRCTSG